MNCCSLKADLKQGLSTGWKWIKNIYNKLFWYCFIIAIGWNWHNLPYETKSFITLLQPHKQIHTFTRNIYVGRRIFFRFLIVLNPILKSCIYVVVLTVLSHAHMRYHKINKIWVTHCLSLTQRVSIYPTPVIKYVIALICWEHLVNYATW